MNSVATRTGLSLLQRLRHGALRVTLPDGSVRPFGDAPSLGLPVAELAIHDWQVFKAALKSGDIGFAEGYMAGHWSTPDLTALLELFIRNRQEIDEAIFGSWLGRLVYRIKHLFNRNTRSNSPKNIHAHYDLGNAFYQLWLDPSMSYSSAWFGSEKIGDYTQALMTAQHAKVRRALQLAGVKPGTRVLEIGCGWGALAEMAALECDATLVGVTLSTEQLAYAQQRLSNAGIATARVDLRLQDYRDIDDGPYDAICSIEMLEAVGQEYWETYFAAIHRLLKPGGRAVVQSIVIADALFDRYVTSTDFIQQYIFPGGCLPCPREFKRLAAKAGLTVVDEMAFGLDYAETLKRWREAFMAQLPAVRRLGFDDRFVRLWEFYLAYCEAAFNQANIDVIQYTLQK